MTAEILTVALSAAVATILATAAYLTGFRRGTRDLDGAMSVARTLGAYGQLLKIEAESTGTTVQELLARDAAGDTP